MEYVPTTDEERKEMLRSIGVKSIKALFKDIPKEVQLKGQLKIPKGLSELEVTRHLQQLAGLNNPGKSVFLGAGAYRHFVPAAVDQLLLRGEFLTAYTPYQAEASQGNLQAIYEYQTYICQLTGMDLANSSVYDGATATAESAIMACNLTGRNQVVVSEAVHPQYREVLATYGRGGKFLLRTVPAKAGSTDKAAMQKAITDRTAAVILQSPNFFGVIEDTRRIAKLAHDKKALLISTVAEATSLALLTPPGELGADIVAGDGQSFGNPLNFGGPYLGFMATHQEHVHAIPGRLVGETVDTEGKRGYMLTLQAREQHIRRERATSNICTSQQLNALACAIHLALLGPNLKALGELNLQKAHYCRKAFKKAGFTIPFAKHPHYNEFVIQVPRAKSVHAKLAKQGIIAGLPIAEFYPQHPELKDCLLLCVTELNTKDEIDGLVSALKGARK